MLWIGSSVSQKQKQTLTKLNIPFSVLADEPSLPAPLASHPDMRAITVGGKTFSAGESAKMLGCTDTGEAFGKAYPCDALFNGFVLGNRLVCNPKSFSGMVLRYAEAIGMEILPVRQGYAKCSTLLLDETHAVTADQGIAKTLAPFCGVLTVREGGVLLLPYAYGFLGGASFTLGNTVYFFGNLQTHPDAEAIYTYMKENGFTAVSLSDEPLTDCGGALWIE